MYHSIGVCISEGFACLCADEYVGSRVIEFCFESAIDFFLFMFAALFNVITSH